MSSNIGRSLAPGANMGALLKWMTGTVAEVWEVLKAPWRGSATVTSMDWVPVASPDVRSQARNQRDTFTKKYLLGTNLTLFIAIGDDQSRVAFCGQTLVNVTQQCPPSVLNCQVPLELSTWMMAVPN